jgi:hypothetical protein
VPHPTPAVAEAVRHLDDVIAAYDAMARNPRSATTSQVEEVYVRLRAAIFRWAPRDSEYAKHVLTIDPYNKKDNEWRAHSLVGIARSLRQDHSSGFIAASFGALIRSDVFADFLDMAEPLLSSGYKDPAAVLIGAVLEAHIRKLCVRNGIPIDEKGTARKADALNADLAKNSVYTKLDQKSITAWQDLRNNAAHGKFSSYTDAQVDLMHRGVRDFLGRLPA